MASICNFAPINSYHTDFMLPLLYTATLFWLLFIISGEGVVNKLDDLYRMAPKFQPYEMTNQFIASHAARLVTIQAVFRFTNLAIRISDVFLC